MKEVYWLPGAGSGRVLTAEGHKGIFWVMEIFYMLIIMVMTQGYTFVKTQTVPLPCVHFPVCKLYHNKFDIKVKISSGFIL